MSALPDEDEPGRSVGAGSTDDGRSGTGLDEVEDRDGSVHFHFPIDIRLVAGADDDLVDRVVTRVFDELRRELERRA
ncbi:MAG TPA: hypothetical protein VIP98_11275 [Microlunatus sp.]